MNKVFVFCIGGTGIRVMKSITMLMAGGMSTNGYVVVPIIVDPHLDLEEKKNLHSLIESYQNIYERSVSNGNSTLNPLDGFFNSKIETLPDIKTKQTDTKPASGLNEKFRNYINVARLGTDNINNLLVETMFSSKNLDSPLSVGFKGNPNVGTVVLSNMMEHGVDWFSGFMNQCADGDRVFIISSIFGGTGASGYPLLEKKIREADSHPAVRDAIMGAVTVLPYYGLKDPQTSGSDIDSANFYTKTKAALAYYEKTVRANYLYYVGEKSMRQIYENDEHRQDDKAHFVELVAASALFDFLSRPKPERQQFMTRAIEDDKDSMSLMTLGRGYRQIIKCVADYMLLRKLVMMLPDEKYFPLKINRGFDDGFYGDNAYKELRSFTDWYFQWYSELASNNRAFAPLNYDKIKQMDGWIKDITLDAANDTYYLLEMVRASNAHKKREHNNKFRFFLQFAHEAIDHYTQKIYN